MAVVVPVSAVPAQFFTTILNNQATQLNIYQRSTGLFMDVYVDSNLIIGGVICLDRNLIVRDAYLGFSGDLAFFDTQPTPSITGAPAVPSDPFYSGLGSRFFLGCWTAAELAAVGKY